MVIWDDTSVHTIAVEFATPDEARFFFNAGGNIEITASRAGGGSGEDNAAFDQLLPDVNIVRFSAQGTNKIGGLGTPVTEATTIGYYDMTTSPSTVFQQNPTGYTSGTFFRIDVQTNGVDQAGSGDAGDILTFTSTMATTTTVSPGVDGTCTVTATVNFPSTVYLTNTWGAVTFPTVTVVQT